MSYYSGERANKIREEALQDAMNCSSLWSFIHSTLMRVCESQGGVHTPDADGFFAMRKPGQVGEFDINTAAEYLEIALGAREEFLRDRAENDKSG